MRSLAIGCYSWKPNDHGCSHSFFAFDLQCSLMMGYNALNKGKPESGTALFSGAGFVCHKKFVANLFNNFWFHADPVIGHLKFIFCSGNHLTTNGYAPIFKRSLLGIIDQVNKNSF